MKAVIGLTGGIGSGKSTVANMLAAQGATVVDTDQIAHLLTAPGGTAIPAIRQTFGEASLSADGAMDRPRMRERVFADEAARRQLEAILHPMIRNTVLQAMQRAHGPYILLVVPLLLETGAYRDLISRILVVDVPEAVQKQRTMQRSGLSASTVDAIMASQATRAARLAAADDVVCNLGSPDELQTLINALHQRYLSLSGEHSNS